MEDNGRNIPITLIDPAFGRDLTPEYDGDGYRDGLFPREPIGAQLRSLE